MAEPRSRERTPLLVVTPPRAARLQWVLRVVRQGEQPPAAAPIDWTIPDQGIVLGRAPEDPKAVTQPIDVGEASRTHLRVALKNGVPELEDLGSTNGTWLNGHRSSRATLGIGSVVRLGQTILVVGRGSSAPGDGYGLFGAAPAIAEVRRLVAVAGPSSLPVMILGPTGTGKELVAHGLHVASGRKGEFVAVNGAALPATLVESALFGHKRGAFTDARSDEPGAFVRASGGTLFLDEIGDMSPEAQVKILRALETGEVVPVGATRPTKVDVRVVVATHRPVVGAGTVLREDLYARLAGVVIKTPPLRDRREDVLPLFRSFLPVAVRARPAEPAFDEALVCYDWPRNVRELRRLAERLALLHVLDSEWRADMLEPEMLPAEGESPIDDATPSADPNVPWPPTPESLQALIDACNGNVSAAAHRVGRNRKQIYRWLERFGMADAADKK